MWQQRSQLASLDKNVYSQYELCSVGLTPLWDCSRLVRLHWRTSCRGSRLGVEVGERGGAGGHTVHLQQVIKVMTLTRRRGGGGLNTHHLIAKRSRLDKLSGRVGGVTPLA